MNKIKTLYNFLEIICLENKFLIFWSSTFLLKKLSDSDNYNDVDIATNLEWFNELFFKLKQSNIWINDIKIENWINKMWFWLSNRLSFIIEWLEFECFCELDKSKWVFWKYLENLELYWDKYKNNFFTLKLPYLKESYIKLTKMELIELKNENSIEKVNYLKNKLSSKINKIKNLNYL